MSPVRNPYFLLLLAFCSFITTGRSQSLNTNPDKYYIEHFGEDEGLPQNSVNSILPDHNDFLWIATEGGITRFNGNRFLPVPGVSGMPRNNFTRIRSFY